MKNKNIGITTMGVIILVAVLALVYHYHMTTPVAKSIDSSSDIPAEVPEPSITRPQQ
ncbi:hypothetical protein [Legionella clemsonensis]|uniref:Uncharacterized protein n=1 Tax=Legionella clemsonensis TaxID=1867846 RepID=A0A222P5P3_9GAMM|nr:hypothetical protein [Legionella clemsonensis]ASQ47152.1 hypothetical protein clem_13095 [Legionella clemsonensis]